MDASQDFSGNAQWVPNQLSDDNAFSQQEDKCLQGRLFSFIIWFIYEFTGREGAMWDRLTCPGNRHFQIKETRGEDKEEGLIWGKGPYHYSFLCSLRKPYRVLHRGILPNQPGWWRTLILVMQEANYNNALELL